MSNSKTTKRALLTSVLALMLCFAMLTGTTFAWFTDTETSSGNKIVAGTLDVELLLWDGNADYVNISEESKAIFTANGDNLVANNSLNTIWEPGKTQVAYLAIENKGNLDLKYMVNLDTRNPIDGKDLYEVMSYVIVPDASFGAAIDWNNVKGGALAVEPGIFAVAPATELSVGGIHYFALVIHMDENAGNEYQAGKVEFDISVLATQLNAEEDAFGKDYDKNANFDAFGYGVMAIDGRANYDFRVEDILNSTPNSAAKIAQVDVPAAAVDPAASELKVTVEKLAKPNAEVVITSEQSATTYEIEFEGLKDNNDTMVKVTLKTETGLTGVKVFHHGVEVTSPMPVYNSEKGEVTFFAKEFSPYTIVYDTIAKEIVKEDISTATVPKATIVVNNDYINNSDITWSGSGAYAPKAGLETMLDAAFVYSLGETTVEEAMNSPYSDWYCDFYVSLDKDLPVDKMFLAGSYGSYLNIGFHVTETLYEMNGVPNNVLPANQVVPLLALAIGKDVNTEWTYASIASFVNEFTCGVGDVDGALDGATFTVRLRLTNPETREFIDVNTVSYTFGTSVATIDGETVAFN